MYRCNDCGRGFEAPDTVAERHGLVTAPFEQLTVCPHCRGTSFDYWRPDIPKLEVAERVLEAVADLHRFMGGLKGLFPEAANKSLDGAVGNLCELVLEMFPYADNNTDTAIFKVADSTGVKEILKALEGLG